ncbi:MAG: ATP-binding cassette domain-containing protein [Deltaproteobacteria bacterium]|nr:MAG: ATP-binding cassette domain-containing protein [Deltaproteobacteria bacterium]
MRFSCRDITFKYPDASNYVFKNLSFELTEPGFNALFGPSGVGKTSFAKIITGEIKEFSGEISTDSMKILLYSYNLERLPGWSSVGKHLEKIIPLSQKSKKDELVEAFGLKEFIGARFSQLSLGQQNRVNLIRYLLQDFQMLIMDESLANVDELTREKILLKIKDMFPQTFFLYISHNVIEVSKFCKQILVLRSAGKIPQVITVEGENYSTLQQVDKQKLEQTMLEVMNASS